ncbi:hypothetical protein NECAME_17143 [Necator americanus]|uniref:Uncharacterized protein n=1 Tax=Necator americanus TaxID=51031 RepID=W2TRL8_NECAM|nr:hypothetical protein NECAME_17143 [Necator americanus]ETN84453.1 hypothetical protein NECAME_17143 [Necator americanus]
MSIMTLLWSIDLIVCKEKLGLDYLFTEISFRYEFLKNEKHLNYIRSNEDTDDITRDLKIAVKYFDCVCVLLIN